MLNENIIIIPEPPIISRTNKLYKRIRIKYNPIETELSSNTTSIESDTTQLHNVHTNISGTTSTNGHTSRNNATVTSTNQSNTNSTLMKRRRTTKNTSNTIKPLLIEHVTLQYIKPLKKSDSMSSDQNNTNGNQSDSVTTSNTIESNTAALFDAISEDLKCCICMDLLMDPVALSCSHVFCNICITAWRIEQAKQYGTNDLTKLICPQCRSEVNEPMRVNVLSNIIDKLIISMSHAEQAECNKRIKSNKIKQNKLDKRIKTQLKKHQSQLNHTHTHHRHDGETLTGHTLSSLVFDDYRSDEDLDYTLDDAMRDCQRNMRLRTHTSSSDRNDPMRIELINNEFDPIEINDDSDTEHNNFDNEIYTVSRQPVRSASQCTQCELNDTTIQRNQLRVCGRIPGQQSSRHTWHIECFANSDAVRIRNLPLTQLHGVNNLQPDEQAILSVLFNE